MMSHNGNGRPSGGGKLAEGSLSRGTVVRVDRAKGFGFLIDSSGEHRFFHRSAVLDNGFEDLKEQQAVDFEAHNDERGARAIKVRPAGMKPLGSKEPNQAKSASRPTKAAAWRSDLSPFRSGTGAPAAHKRKPLI